MSAGERVVRAFDVIAVRKALRNCLGADSVDCRLAMAWLADATHATADVARETQSETDRAIGRRQIWLLIQDAMNMTEQDIRDLQEQVAGWETQG